MIPLIRRTHKYVHPATTHHHTNTQTHPHTPPVQAASAVINTHISACTGGLVWFVGAYIRNRHWSVTEILSGVFAGLASITAGSGDLTSRSAFCIGLISGVCSMLWATYIKAWDRPRA